MQGWDGGVAYICLCVCRDSKLKEQAIQVLRDLLASHDSDSRFNSGECRATIASIYLPLLSIVMDNFPNLYKGADGWEDWTTTFERNSAVRRSVIIREAAEGGASSEVCKLTCTYIHTHIHTHTHTYTNIHTYIHKHTYIHTHKHTYIMSCNVL